MLRGPIVSRVINQLIVNTAWGELDYLVREGRGAGLPGELGRCKGLC